MAVAVPRRAFAGPGVCRKQRRGGEKSEVAIDDVVSIIKAKLNR